MHASQTESMSESLVARESAATTDPKVRIITHSDMVEKMNATEYTGALKRRSFSLEVMGPAFGLV